MLTPDDEGRLKERHWGPKEPTHETNLTPQARPNVIFEAGMAMGRDANRTILVQIGEEIRPFSDIAGRHYVHLRGSSQDRKNLINRLKNTGCAVDDSTAAWISAGDFEAAFQATVDSAKKEDVEDSEVSNQLFTSPNALWKTIIASPEIRPGVFRVDGTGEVFVTERERKAADEIGGNPRCLLTEATSMDSYVPQYLISRFIPHSN